MSRRNLFGLVIVVPLVLAVALSVTSQTTPQASQQTRKTAKFVQPVSIPFELVTRHIVLSARVNDSRPLSFILDTGDRFAIIKLDLANELGLTLSGQVSMGGAGSELSTGAYVKSAKFTIVGLPGFSQPVTHALPIGRMAPRLGHDFDGIIGSEFIKEFVVEIDYQSRMLRLHDKEKFTYSGTGESIPIELDPANHPIVEAEVTPIGTDPVRGKFVLDIGSSGALALYSPFVAQRHLLDSKMKTFRAMGAGAGGDIAGRVGRVTKLKIGNFTIDRPITMFSLDKKGAFASAVLRGNIGAQILSKFKLFLDYNHKRIIFEPNATFAKPFDNAVSGLRVQAEGKDYSVFRIADVLEDSPATEAGLQVNDIITAIDGKPTADLTLTELNELFEKSVTYKLTVLRGEQTIHVKLTPRVLV